MSLPNPRLSQFNYDLPQERIAKYPLAQRDRSKLLVWEHGQISHQHFHVLPQLLPEKSMLVFNDTRVLHARLHFQKETGARIEIFCLKPASGLTPEESLAQQQEVVWECLIGNLKRWRNKQVLQQQVQVGEIPVLLEVEYVEPHGAEHLVRFRWSGGVPFSEVLEVAGHIPLPPYLKRQDEAQDANSYQTVYARHAGAVAAPTAGLHFTEQVLHEVKQRGIAQEYLTLHVSAGTFRPVEVEAVREHPMHTELFSISRGLVEALLGQQGPVVAVGTTSMRALESLYWAALSWLEQEGPLPEVLSVEKLRPYQQQELPPVQEVLGRLLLAMQQQGREVLHGTTEIMIMPGYQWRLCEGLVTNFHMPKSTLLMLIAAFIGEEWKRVYQEALQKDYRFLSYGDSSLLWRK